MAYKIDERQVAGVVRETGTALLPHRFNPPEVVIGLAELIGRSIVDMADNHIQMRELEEIVHKHIHRTITIGAHASGKSGLARV